MPSSPEFKPNPAVTAQLVKQGNKKKQISDMELHIQNADGWFNMGCYKDAVGYYEAALRCCPEDYSKTELYRKMALSHKALGEQNKEQALHYGQSIQYCNESLKKSAKNFDSSTFYFKQALGECKKNKNIDEIRDHFRLAEIYIIKNKFGKALHHVLAGLELNLVIKPADERVIAAEDTDGLRILATCLNEVGEETWAISYHEQTIAMLGELQKKYPGSSFKSSIEDTRFNLELLKKEPPEDAPKKSYTVFSFRDAEKTNGEHTNTVNMEVPVRGFLKRPADSSVVSDSIFAPSKKPVEMILEPVAKKQNTSSVPSCGN